jgi:hypothetical protein
MSHCLSKADHFYTLPLGRYFPKRTYGVVLLKGRLLSPAAGEFIRTIRTDGKRHFPIPSGNSPSIRSHRRK